MCTVPPVVQEDALEMIVGIIRRHSDHFVLLGMDTLGKEELLCAISDALGDTKVRDTAHFDEPHGASA
jgi:hypothetical protein